MAEPKKIVVAADGTVTSSPAVVADMLTTLVSTDSAVTGTYGLIQKGALVAFGMALQNNRLGRGWNPLSAE